MSSANLSILDRGPGSTVLDMIGRTPLVRLNRFEADYSGGGHAPTIEVVLDCTFGRYRDRTLLANFTAHGSAAASDDRIGAVVAAFESATGKALGELERNVAEALAAEKPPENPPQSPTQGSQQTR